ncbi:aspartate--tRNA(Asn) ligase [archaeon]|nr:aspartate--tRNA(Asn) ligase [archaeon]
MRKYSNEITPSSDGERVEVAGWVHDKRKLGGLVFLIIRDRTGLIQITLPKKFIPPKVFELTRNLSKESVISVVGKVQKEDKAPNGYEIIPDSIEILSRSATPLLLDPTGKVDANLDTRLDNRVMDLRRSEITAIFKIRAAALSQAREFLGNSGFIEVTTPSIISTSSEGGTELFPVSYFEEEAFLAQSPQLYKQMMMGTGLDRVFETAKYFRAEEHDTIWHLNEVSAIDCELAFIKDERDVMKIIEGLVVAMINVVREKCKRELEILNCEIPEPKTPFPMLKYDDALAKLEDCGMKVPFGEDLSSEAEKRLGEVMREEGHDLYFITKYPLEIKPFYTMPDAEEGIYSNAFDMEYKGREIVSGSQRVHEHDLLVERIKEKGLVPENFKSYLSGFKFGMPPHGGFGLGIERFLVLLLGLPNIREAVLFPRDRKRLEP